MSDGHEKRLFAAPELHPMSDIIASLVAFLAAGILGVALRELMSTDLPASGAERYQASDAFQFSGRFLIASLAGILLWRCRKPLALLAIAGLLPAVGLLMPGLGFDLRIMLGLVALSIPLVQVSAYLHLADSLPSGHRLADVAFLGAGMAQVIGHLVSNLMLSHLPIGGRGLTLFAVAALISAFVLVRGALRPREMAPLLPGTLALIVVMVLQWRFDLAQSVMTWVAPLGLLAMVILLFDRRVAPSASLALMLVTLTVLQFSSEALFLARGGIDPWREGAGILYSPTIFLVPGLAAIMVVLTMSAGGSRRRFLAAFFMLVMLLGSTVLFFNSPLRADFPIGGPLEDWNRFAFLSPVETVAWVVAAAILTAGLLIEVLASWRPLVVGTVLGLVPFCTQMSLNRFENWRIDQRGPGMDPTVNTPLFWTTAAILVVFALLLLWRRRDDPAAGTGDGEQGFGQNDRI